MNWQVWVGSALMMLLGFYAILIGAEPALPVTRSAYWSLLLGRRDAPPERHRLAYVLFGLFLVAIGTYEVLSTWR